MANVAIIGLLVIVALLTTAIVALEYAFSAQAVATNGTMTAADGSLSVAVLPVDALEQPELRAAAPTVAPLGAGTLPLQQRPLG